MVSRRHFLQLFLASGALSSLSAKTLAQWAGRSDIAADQPLTLTEVTSLAQIAASAGLLFGSAFDMASINDPAYGALLKHHCSILTTDYQLKFWTLRPTADQIDFTRADQLVAFAKNASIALRGHTLIWNEWNPPWLKQASTQQVTYWLDRHIDEVVGRYAGQFHSWDVVNEPMWPAHNKAQGLRSGPWLNASGPDYVRRAFNVAAHADPKAKRVLNEAWLERGDHWGKALRAAFLPFVDQLLQQGTPIDAIGLQCHLAPGNLDMDAFLRLVEQLKSYKLDIYVTELDVNDASFADELVMRDRGVAQSYQGFLQELLALRAVSVVQTWQLSDKYSFYQKPQQREVRVLPFDKNMQPKAAYQALASVFLAAAG